MLFSFGMVLFAFQMQPLFDPGLFPDFEEKGGRTEKDSGTQRGGKEVNPGRNIDSSRVLVHSVPGSGALRPIFEKSVKILHRFAASIGADRVFVPGLPEGRTASPLPATKDI